VDKGLGVVVTALVQKGSLKIGDYVLAGNSWGKVRRLVSDQKRELKEAGPSTPVQVYMYILKLYPCLVTIN
jgi:translation initiation factor IF-2